MESTEGDVTTVAMRCADKTQIDFSKVDACTKSKLGNQLQHIYAVRTESLQPQHQYVPWVTINGVHTEELEREAERDLVKLICKTYKVIDLRSNFRMIENVVCFRVPIHLLHAINNNNNNRQLFFHFFFFFIHSK
jgi:hypothetical protein